MTLFKHYTFNWKQVGVFKVSLLAIGIIIGSYWHEFFRANMTALVIIAIIATAYIMYVSLRQ